MIENTMSQDKDRPEDTAMGLLIDLTDAQSRLEKSIEGLTERLAAALGPAPEQPMTDPHQITSVPKQTSDLVSRARDLNDTARRLIIRLDLLTQRVEL